MHVNVVSSNGYPDITDTGHLRQKGHQLTEKMLQNVYLMLILISSFLIGLNILSLLKLGTILLQTILKLTINCLQKLKKEKIMVKTVFLHFLSKK